MRFGPKSQVVLTLSVLVWSSGGFPGPVEMRAWQRDAVEKIPKVGDGCKGWRERGVIAG